MVTLVLVYVAGVILAVGAGVSLRENSVTPGDTRLGAIFLLVSFVWPIALLYWGLASIGRYIGVLIEDAKGK